MFHSAATRTGLSLELDLSLRSFVSATSLRPVVVSGHRYRKAWRGKKFKRGWDWSRARHAFTLARQGFTRARDSDITKRVIQMSRNS